MRYLFTFLAFIIFINSNSQIKKEAKSKDKNEIKKDSVQPNPFSALKFRSIGPALTSGRIADFAVNPDNPSEYYVGVAAGGVWKTVNNGTTFEPIFDKYGSFSVGCLAMDPKNHNVIWVGNR